MATNEFKSIGIQPFLSRALTAMAIHAPTEVQKACIPAILEGRDCIGNARTGSGKTMAFALPILQRLSKDPYGIFALVLTPTRELAFQIYDQFVALGSVINLESSVIVGGMDMIVQANELRKRPHVVIATPGRLADLIRSNPNEIVLSKLQFLVLDEADRLLSDTFAQDLQYILGFTPSHRQTLLFTATMTESVLALQNREPLPGKQKPFVHLAHDEINIPSTLKQHYTFIPSQVRDIYLYYMLSHLPTLTGYSSRKRNPKRAEKKTRRKTDNNKPVAINGEEELEIESMPQTILFVSSCRSCAELSIMLGLLSINNAALHSSLTQRERLKALDDFRASRVPLLVATDVASRGLDIPDVDVVVNWDLPRFADDYIHRVGRAARAGRNGVACNFVTESDVDIVAAIEDRVGAKMIELQLPEKLVLECMNQVMTHKRMAIMQLHSEGFGNRKKVNERKAASQVSSDASKRNRRKKQAKQ